MDTIKKIRIAWISGLAVLALVLIYLAIVPFGTIAYESDFLHDDYFIGRLTPRERLAGETGIGARTITGEPVYFSLFTPRPFRRAEVTVEYAGDAPVLEVGLRRDKTVWQFERQPLRHAGLDALAQDKNTIVEDGLLLWQRDKRYGSIGDFLHDLPPAQAIATYDYNPAARFRLAEYAPSAASRTIEVGARGNYLMQTYSGGEAIDMALELHDLNQNKDKDEVTVTVYNEKNEGVAKETLADDGGEADVASEARVLRIKTGRLEAGPYRVEVKANDDIITDRIITAQSRLAFINRLWLAAAGRRELRLVSDVSRLSAQTIAPGSLQVLSYAGRELKLSQTYEQFSIESENTVREGQELIIKKDDIIISGDGVFAFSRQDLIDPAPRQFTPAPGKEKEFAPYVIARYAPASTEGQGKAVFELSGAYREKGKYSFMIAAPDIERYPAGMEIRSVKVRLSGPNAFEYLARFWKKI